SKPAAHALLARTYLFMRDYGSCFLYADSCLQHRSGILDYNDLNEELAYPFEQFNEEVLHHSRLQYVSTFPTAPSRALIDTALFASYHEDDLRKSLFFKENGNGTY